MVGKTDNSHKTKLSMPVNQFAVKPKMNPEDELDESSE